MATSTGVGGGEGAFDPRAISRPDPSLMRYYVLVSLLTGPGFPFALLACYFRYISLRYRLDDEGVWMAHGVLFKKEVNLTYRRIQDIHVTRNIIQRWMGLATVSVQTASGSATPEMTIEGILQADELRDWLYQKMRGAKGQAEIGAAAGSAAVAGTAEPGAPEADEALVLLRDIRDSLRALQERLGERPAEAEGGS
jgi:putative membrane protein